MERDYSTFWEAIIIMCFLFLLIRSGNSSDRHYQVATCGKKGAIIIDQITGEAWSTGDCEEVYLEPLAYANNQKNEWEYTPEENRNKKNKSWWQRIKESWK